MTEPTKGRLGEYIKQFHNLIPRNASVISAIMV